ncbi:hypothetical protein RhiLY_08783 [Ceratobasidium sp. AG-Ba]|nr:hypothetical protein RhiLY_08783 [Ceratobasidium sp. AG-Ba]
MATPPASQMPSYIEDGLYELAFLGYSQNPTPGEPPNIDGKYVTAKRGVGHPVEIDSRDPISPDFQRWLLETDPSNYRTRIYDSKRELGFQDRSFPSPVMLSPTPSDYVLEIVGHVNDSKIITLRSDAPEGGFQPPIMSATDYVKVAENSKQLTVDRLGMPAPLPFWIVIPVKP